MAAAAAQRDRLDREQGGEDDEADAPCRVEVVRRRADGERGGDGQAAIEEQDDGTCNVTPADSFIPIVIRYGENESIEAAKLIVENGEDLTIGGNPAYYGEFMGGILYIEKGGQTLVLQAPLSNEDKDKLISVANVAITRFP